MEIISKSERRAPYILILILIILAAGIVTAGYLYYHHYKKHYRVEVERQLSAIAKLKVDELVDWRNERLGDAGIFYKNAVFSALVQRYFETPDDADAQGQIRTWLSKVQTAHEYDQVMLMDTQFSKKLIVSEETDERSTSFVSPSSFEALRSGKVCMEDFYRNEHNQRIYLKVLVPILDEANDNRPIGILDLRIDPEKYLYPFINKWPTPSRTAETLLVRREGNEVLFLNELRFQKNTALNLRFPLNEKIELPAVKAAMGQEGIVQGIDYRRVPVIADVRSVPDSPWFLVARMDTSEVYEPLKEKLWVTIVLVSILLTGTSACAGLVWKQQSARFYRQKYEAEETLRESEERLRMAMEAAEVGTWRWDPVTNMDTRDASFNRMLGLEPLMSTQPVEEFIGFVHPEERRGVEDAIGKALRERGQYFAEFRIVRSDGEVRWLNDRGRLICNEAGEVRYMTGAVVDITERKQAEETLRESEARYKALFAGAPEGMIVADLQTKQFRYANPAMCRMFGYTEEEFLRIGVANIHPKESIDYVLADFEAQARGEKLSSTDIPCQRKDGSLFYANVNAIMVVLDGRKCNVGIFTDVTERKQAEETLLNTNRQLEEATAKANEMTAQAEAANEAKSQFLANMSHEIRTPLNAIIGFSEVLMEEELTEEQKDYVGLVYNSGKHLLHLINDILDLSKIEAGKMNIEMKQCSLGQFIANIESMMQPFATEKGLKFEIREKGDLPANIVTDATRLQQCLINLMNNAIKFTEQGHIYVNISLEHKDSKPRIRFEVEDTGIGISPEFQQKIFESFVQEDGSTSRKYGGTGLGLAITRKLTELLGGELTLTSEKGKGSVFSLVIPAGVDLATQPLLNRQKFSDHISTDMNKAKHARFSGSVLVAEDVESNQMLMKFLLERMGLKITIAENGIEAVNKALGQEFDLIFMDIQMPEVNGYEATRTLRSKGIKTPIIALTAGAMEGDNEKCIEAGCDDYLPKPVVHSKLIEVLNKYLEKVVLPEDGDVTVKSDNDKVSENYLSQIDTPDNEEVIDWAEIVAGGLDEQSMKEIIPTYMKKNKEHLRELISAVKTSNAEDVKLHAHAIKGAGRNLGVARLSELAGQLETMALKEDLSEAEELLKNITSEFYRLEEFVAKPDWIEIAKEQSTNRLELGSNRKSS
jgi:PAS domain S-box-containing protein